MFEEFTSVLTSLSTGLYVSNSCLTGEGEGLDWGVANRTGE